MTVSSHNVLENKPFPIIVAYCKPGSACPGPGATEHRVLANPIHVLMLLQLAEALINDCYHVIEPAVHTPGGEVGGQNHKRLVRNGRLKSIFV